MPTESIITTGSPVKDFIANTLKQIRDGIKEGNAEIHDYVNFDLNITEVKTSHHGGQPAEVDGTPVIVIGGKELANAQRVSFKVMLNDVS